MSIMDELSAAGEAVHSDTMEYERARPAILNVMLTEIKVLRGDASDWLPLEGLDEPVPVETNYGRWAPCPTALRRTCWWMRTLPQRASTSSGMRSCAPCSYLDCRRGVEDIEMLYGGVGGGSFSRW